MLLYLLVIVPIIIAVITYLIPLRYSKVLAIIFHLISYIISILLFVRVIEKDCIKLNIGGYDDFIGISLKVDRLSGTLLLLATGIFLLVGIYQLTCEYTDNMFLFLYLCLQGVIMGIIISNDLFNIFVLIEVATIIISILIMFKKDKQEIYDGLYYLIVSVVAMSFFVFGVGILYKNYGFMDIDALNNIIAKSGKVKELTLPFAFIMTGIAVKIALMPFFGWLPKAHGAKSAPTGVSAILSGVYIKTTILVFIKLRNMFKPIIDIDEVFLLLAILTAIFGIVFALIATDVKKILAYSTVSQIGLILIGINLKNDYAFYGALYHILSHAIYKATLFLAAGLIITRYKTKDINLIKGVYKNMRIVAISSVFAILGIIGAPFFNGSVSKYFLAYGAKESIVEYLLFFLNLGTILVFVRFIKCFFVSKDKSFDNFTIKEKTRNHRLEEIVVLVMGVLCLVGGIFGVNIIKLIFDFEAIINYKEYLNKSILFVLSLGIALIMNYLNKKRKSKIFKKDIKIIKEYSLEPRFVVLLMLCFLVAISVYIMVQ